MNLQGALFLFFVFLLTIGDYKIIRLPVAVIEDEFGLYILVDDALLKKIRRFW